MRKSILLLLLALAPVACVHAAVLAPPARLGLCAPCHGEDGHARIPGAPNLAGQPYAYLLQALHEYHDGQRKVPVMQTAAGPLSDQDMHALARWFAAQSPCKSGQASGP